MFAYIEYIRKRRETHVFFLVTGGAGFIGANLVSKLLQLGHQVRVVDNFSTGKKENLQDLHPLEVIRGDIRDYKICVRAMKNIDYVLHLAAIASVQKSMEDPRDITTANITGTVNIFEAARKANVARVVISSSSAVYGQTKRLPNEEKALPQPLSPYGISKYVGELYAKFYAEAFGLNTVALRYFNVFGPKQSFESEYSGVISKFINALLQGEQPIIYGSGEQKRDFIFVDNVVEANILASMSQKVGHGEVINIGSGEEISINHLLRDLKSLINPEIEPIYGKPREGEIQNTCADITRAKDWLDFSLTVGFKEGLKRTIQWYQSQYA